jgi:hypothetical protein
MVTKIRYPLPPSLHVIERVFVGVAHQVQQRLPQPHLVGMQRSDRSVTMSVVGLEGFEPPTRPL